MVAIVKTLLGGENWRGEIPLILVSQIHPRISAAVELLTFEPAHSIRVIDAINPFFPPFAK